MYFYVPIHFFKVLFDFFSLPKPAFCKAKVHRGTPKGGKMSVPFFLESNGIFSCIFTCYFISLRSLLIFPQFQKEHFARPKCIRVPPKEQKCHFFFSLIEWHFFHVFLRVISFFQLSFDFPSLPKPAFCKAKVHSGTPKGAKMSFLFFFNQIAFFHVFLRAISFLQSLFQFCFRCKGRILQV